MKTRVYYQSDPAAVVLQKNGKDVLTYRSVTDLVETHIKGLLAVNEHDGEFTRELRSKYRTPPKLD